MYIINKDYKETFINLEKDLKDNVFEELEINIWVVLMNKQNLSSKIEPIKKIK